MKLRFEPDWNFKHNRPEKFGRVVCCIGSRVVESYWTGPPATIDHVDKEYLHDRYPIIRTEKQAERFKELWKIMFAEVTEEQLEEMRHAIGLDYHDKPYRNRFCDTINDNWEDLIKKGLATKREFQVVGGVSEYMYYLNKAGVELAYGKPISERKFKEL